MTKDMIWVDESHTFKVPGDPKPAHRLLDGWLQLGIYCLGGQVLVRRDPLQFNPGTPPRLRRRGGRSRWEGHRIRKARRLEA